MIQQLSTKYQLYSATLLFTICFNGIILPSYALRRFKTDVSRGYIRSEKNILNNTRKSSKTAFSVPVDKTNIKNIESDNILKPKVILGKKNTPQIGGPSQPEMAAFKSANAENMVNLFTGDFSYNIPLLDVGGYPVNIFYDGGITMEQEASWVGLGWNINPGSVSRNMRGVPDDFNGEDILTQTQTMKPNITWGITLGADLELIGIKDNPFSGSIGGSIGVSSNNYLGPALDIGIRGNTGLSISSKADAEKNAPRLGGSLSINASSRSGVTFSPAVSLTANAFKTDKGATGGFGLHASTSYNSRNGIKALQISDQMYFNRMSAGISSSSISFTKPSYIPSIRMPLTNSAFSGHFQTGIGMFGVYASEEVEVYKQKSEVLDEDVIQKKPMFGYLYLQEASGNQNAVMDFSRENDNEVTPSTPIISAPQYSYDVFSIQGEGTGGSIRAYRNDEGYVRDNYTLSKDKNFSFGADVGIPGHYGANFNVIKTPSTIGEWGAGNKLHSTIGFKNANNNFENVYFKNPGETTVLNSDEYDNIGGINLVRYKLGGSGMSPTIEPVLEKFLKDGKVAGTSPITATVSTERKKRSQVINFLTAEQASVIGLDQKIKSYDRTDIMDNHGILLFESLPRYDDGIRKHNHISQINVTESNGQRYIYGIPVYNIKQKDFTFTVEKGESVTDPDKVEFNASGQTNEALNLNVVNKDGYLQITETPAYAYSFLLSGLLSPDYVDVTNNGITEDDLGNAVKFNYTKMPGTSKWRTPLTNTPMANFNIGKRTEDKDDKGILSYGERESWYMHSIESKTMIALFKLENRDDNKGSSDAFSGVNSADNTGQRLKEIDLYSKADLKKNGLSGATAIKTVHFEYSYTLCHGTPNNTTGAGKLTLEKIYFTFNGQTRASKNQYVFSYGSTPTDNPVYAFNASDRWGTYKPATANPASINNNNYPHDNLKNSDYPYSIQDKNLKTTIDANAGAWMLKKILLPSGGQLEVTYESDDYAFVQDKRAAAMMHVLGFGSDATHITNQLYTVNGDDITENFYVFINVPDRCNSDGEVYQKYLSGIDQLSFKLGVNMPKGLEFLHSYATFDQRENEGNYGRYLSDETFKTIWIKLRPVDKLSPLSLTAIEFLREQLPGQAYPGYDLSAEENNDGEMSKIGEMLAGWLDGILSAFTDPVNHLRKTGNAQTVDISKCFVRLNDPDGVKYGGGCRVKSLRLKDNWKKMSGDQQYTSEYGQDYDYGTTEIFNGHERPISSGVASYEPTLGGDENPFQTMVQVSNKVPLGPASYGAIEMPVLDAFFPAPSVGYSKVTVRSIKKGITDPNQKVRSGIGKQVTEFYTAKDYPVYYSNTVIDPTSDMQASSSSFGLFFYKYAFDSRALSQGFLVEINDMHGKLKSQASYPENDDKTPVNYTQNFYRNTGTSGLNDKFDFVHAAQGGAISEGNMGIDVELMTDTREFSVKSKSFEVQGQVESFTIFNFPFIWPVSGETENTYRAVTTTKVVSYHGILDRVVVIDKGSEVSTKNLVYDAETGDVVVTQTNNEFNQPVYNTTYPAWWAYSGMGPAYRNIDAIYSDNNFSDGRLLNLAGQNEIFESGDELYILPETVGGYTGCVPESASDIKKIWVLDKNKNTTSLSVPVKDLVFVTDEGKPYTKNGVKFKIVRSGKRNMLNASVATVTSMGSPIVNTKLQINASSKVINATAVEFKEKWKTDNDVIRRLKSIIDPVTCLSKEEENCDGYLERNINPYLKGLLGTFKTNQSKVFYGTRQEKDPLINTNIAVNGFLDNFNLYWAFNSQNNLTPEVNANSKWVWNNQIAEINSRGLELETFNALNVYTAAQYGFNKTMPVAITNNSRYNEMFNESFEDDGYDERLNVSAQDTCIKKHIDFSNLANASIVSSKQAGLDAHTGSKMLKIDGNKQAIKIFDAGYVNDVDYDIILQSDVTKSLSTPGLQDGDDNVGVPVNCLDNYHKEFSNTAGFTLDVPPVDDERQSNNPANPSEPRRFHSYTVKCTTYIQVQAKGIYTFSQSITHLNPNQILSAYSGFSVIISDLDNNVITPLGGNIPNPNEIGTTYGVHYPDPQPSYPNSQSSFYLNLCPGIYKITAEASETLSGYSSYFNENLFTFYCTNYNFPLYKDLNTINGCNYTKPIAATDNMLNPTFSPVPEKEMHFSAWIREDCGAPCYKTDYNKSAVEIWNDGTIVPVNTIARVGSIIEGWQKIEGEFKLPANALLPEIRFINTNSEPMYVDDIRIHPFNANMKSYVYDPVNLRLVAELDENNYATLYEYDEEGSLVRTKVETREGIKTIKETRSAKQKTITMPQ